MNANNNQKTTFQHPVSVEEKMTQILVDLYGRVAILIMYWFYFQAVTSAELML